MDDLDSLVDGVTRQYEATGLREGLLFQVGKAYTQGVEHGIGPGSTAGSIVGFIHGIVQAFNSLLERATSPPPRLIRETAAIIATCASLSNHSADSDAPGLYEVAPIAVRDIVERYDALRRIALRFTASSRPPTPPSDSSLPAPMQCPHLAAALKTLALLPSGDAVSKKFGITTMAAAVSTAGALSF